MGENTLPIIRPLQFSNIKDSTGHSGDCSEPHLNRWNFTKNNSNDLYRLIFPSIFHTVSTRQIPTILLLLLFVLCLQSVISVLIITKTEEETVTCSQFWRTQMLPFVYLHCGLRPPFPPNVPESFCFLCNLCLVR